MEKIKICRATSADAADIACLLYQAFAEYESAYTTQALAATVLTPEEIQTRLGEGPTWVGLRRHVLAGTVSAIPKREELWVRSMAVVPEARGCGIGKLLLQEVEDFARQRGSGHLLLSTTPFLVRAIRLYEHFGFVRSNEGPHELFGTPLFTMRKRLR